MTTRKNNKPAPNYGITFAVTDNGNDIAFVNVAAEGETFYDEERHITTGTLPTANQNEKREYVCWGEDNKLPFALIDLIGKDEVMAANKHFNVLTCYGSGIRFNDPATGQPTTDEKVKTFARANSIPRYFLETATDMKYFYFCVAVLILNKAGNQIVNIRHKDACYCRFEKADKHGRINRVFFADFENSGKIDKDNYEALPLLDEYDPLGDLRQRLGMEIGPDGKKREATKDRKFAIVCKFPTAGNRYYPIPYYAAVFRGYWYNIKQLVGLGKKTKIKNHSGIRYLVQINDEYWESIFKKERITDEAKKKARIDQEKDNINKFLSGVENTGKTLYSGFYCDPNGNEVQKIKITVIDTKTEGGDWAEDIQEAANMLCYADNIHPNLVGATPGKGQQNNSGSDKRELFTLKQSLEIAYHDLMKQPLETVAAFNQWNVDIDIPMITLTTLDTHRDAVQVTAQ